MTKSLLIVPKGNDKYSVSDNYIGVRTGKEKSVIITAYSPIDET